MYLGGMNLLHYVQINRLPGNEDVKLPVKMSELAAGLTCTQEPVVLNPGERQLIPTGFAIAMPAELEAQIRPRATGLQAWHYLPEFSRYD